MTLRKDSQSLNSLFEISSVSFVKCRTCGYQSEKNDIMTEINLCINNPFTKERFDNLELSLLNNLKTEDLVGDNKYHCSKCEKKQDAQKGNKFVSFPKILLFSCGRFVFDLNTFQRVKVNDQFNFPLNLNMNPFLNGFEQAQQHLKDQQPDLFTKKNNIEESLKNRTDKLNEDFTSLHSKKKGKKFLTKKTSNKTKSFLNAQRKKFMNKHKKNKFAQENFVIEIKNNKKGLNLISQIDEGEVFTSVKTDDLINCEKKTNSNVDDQFSNKKKSNDNGNIQTQIQTQNSNIEHQINDTVGKSNNEIASLNKNDKCNNDDEKNNNSNTNEQNTHNNKSQVLSNGNSKHNDHNHDHNSNVKSNGNKRLSTLPVNNPTEEIISETISQVNLDIKKKQHEMKIDGSLKMSQNKHIHTSKNQTEFQEMFKQGPYIYSLYAIFIHKGTAYEGHYFIYIKSFENNLWYLFDDSQVTEVNIVNILKDSIGGSSSYSNAYMLAYKQLTPDQIHTSVNQPKITTASNLNLAETTSLNQLDKITESLTNEYSSNMCKSYHINFNSNSNQQMKNHQCLKKWEKLSKKTCHSIVSMILRLRPMKLSNKLSWKKHPKLKLI